MRVLGIRVTVSLANQWLRSGLRNAGRRSKPASVAHELQEAERCLESARVLLGPQYSYSGQKGLLSYEEVSKRAGHFVVNVNLHPSQPVSWMTWTSSLCHPRIASSFSSCGHHDPPWAEQRLELALSPSLLVVPSVEPVGPAASLALWLVWQGSTRRSQSADRLCSSLEVEERECRLSWICRWPWTAGVVCWESASWNSEEISPSSRFSG